MSTTGLTGALTDDEMEAQIVPPDPVPDPSEVDAYVEAGIKVIRLRARTKKPIVKKWTQGEDPKLVRSHVEGGGNFGALLGEKRFVLDNRQAFLGSERVGSGGDDLPPLGRIEDDVRLAQFIPVVGEVLDQEGVRRMKAVTMCNVGICQRPTIRIG